MMKKILVSFALAIQNIRSHFFHTFLSVLGIVIGVAALVVILSLIDGMEQYAQRQLSATTSLKVITIQTNTQKSVNGVRIRKDTFSVVSPALLAEMQERFPTVTFYAQSSQPQEMRWHAADTTVGVVVHAVSPSVLTRYHVSAGSVLGATASQSPSATVAINAALATTVTADSLQWRTVVGDTLHIDGRAWAVGAVVRNGITQPELYLPLARLTPASLQGNPPRCYAEATSIEEVPTIKEQMGEWLQARSVQPDDFTLQTNDFRVQQAAKGFFLFRLIMGMIVGVSVLVGGIGVMNVLLISVNERTTEIGVRKATGANRHDIVLLFLAESVTVSVFGSLVGLLFGYLVTLIMVPIVKLLVEVPFQAAYTLDTFLVVAVVAVLIGVIFGTYPALRASRLDPVEAMRRE
jgi:putative ABC transport system permease protein